MFCPKCGAQNGSSARFCCKCGAPLEAERVVYKAPEPPVASGTPLAPGASKALSGKAKLIGVIVAALVVAALLGCWILGVFGGSDQEDVVDQFIDSMFDADAQGIVDAIPDEVMQFLMEEMGCTERELVDQLQEALDYAFEYMPEGIKISHRIEETESLYGEDLEEIRRQYAEMGVEVTEAKSVEVELTVSAMGMSESTDIEVGLVKVSGIWCVDFLSMGDIMDDFM